MGQQTIDWVDHLCENWGATLRRRERVSGWPSEAAISRALQGRGGFVQHFPEVMLSPDIRACHVAVMAMWANDLRIPWAACWLKFVRCRSVRRGAAVLGVSVADYRAGLVAANAWVAARVDRPVDEVLTGT